MKTKKLVVAVCLLLVSAVLASTASFAWFSMNTEVGVDGIEVEAYSDALFLQIANQRTGTYSTKTTFNSTKDSLRLVTRVPVDVDELYTIDPQPATGDPQSGVDYYVKSDAKSSNDTFVADNYIKVDNSSFGDATALDTYFRVEFTRVTTSTLAATGVTYYEPIAEGNGYKVATVTAGITNVYGLYTAKSYTVTEDLTFVDGKTYYQMDDNNRSFTEATVTAEEDIDGLYFEKVDGIVALGADAGVYTEADETNFIAYYTSPVSGSYVIATNLTPAEKLDGKYFTIPDTDDDDTDKVTEVDATSVAANSKVWWKNANDDYICVYNNTSPDETVDISGNIFWGKAYSDTLGSAGAQDMTRADVGIIKDATALAEYVYSDTLYLRSAPNTNDGKNLRIENIEIGGRTNALTPALRILFVATNGKGDTATYTFVNNGNSFTSQTLFDTILGNTNEIVTVNVYMYFDGTDRAALTATSNMSALNGQTVAIEFAINDVDYSTNP